MPIYSYKCSNAKCGTEIEEIQKFSDPPLVKCPCCNRRTLKKIISPPLLMGMSNVPVWDKHSDFIRKLKPKYVKDGKTGERKRFR